MITKRRHYHLLDLLKMGALIAIQVLHTHEFIFFEDLFTLRDKSLFFEGVMDYIGRFFTLGGQIIVGVTFFLFGLNAKGRKALLKVSLFALLGQLILSVIFMDLEWDIYIFLSFSCLILSLIPLEKRSLKIWMMVSMGFLIVPPSFWQNTFPAGTFFDILGGRMGYHHSASWAPFPWFFLCLLFLSVGAYVREHKEAFEKWQKVDSILWPLLLILSWPVIGFYYHTPIGPHYYQFNFTQAPWIFWGNFWIYVFWMRISLINRVQDETEKNAFFRWISNLMWSRNLGLTYLVGVIYVGIGMQWDEEFKTIPYLLDVYFALIMPVSEIIVRVLIAGKQRLLPGASAAR